MLHLAARPGAPGATRLQDRSWPAGWEHGKAAGARERSLSPGPCSRGPHPSVPLPTFSFPLTFAPEHWCSSPMCRMLCQECGHSGWRTPDSHDTRSPLKSPLIHLPEGPAHRQVWRRRGPAPPFPTLRHRHSGAGLGCQASWRGSVPPQIWARATARESQGAQGTRGGFPGRRGGRGGEQAGLWARTQPWGRRTLGRAGRRPAAHDTLGSGSSSQVFSRGADRPSPVPGHPGGG